MYIIVGNVCVTFYFVNLLEISLDKQPVDHSSQRYRSPHQPHTPGPWREPAYSPSRGNWYEPVDTLLCLLTLCFQIDRFDKYTFL